MTRRYCAQEGFIFLEVLIALALIAATFITLLGLGFSALTVSASIRGTTQANAMAREEMEAVRSFRDGTASTWSTTGVGSLSTGSGNPYHASQSDGSWQMNTGTETVGNFTRQVVFDKVSRDPTTKNIESTYNGLHDDADTREVTVTISWGTRKMTLISYVTNWQK